MEFDEVLVPTENLLGKEKQDFEIIMSSEYRYRTRISKTRLTYILTLKPSPTSDCGLVSQPSGSDALPTKMRIGMPRSVKLSASRFSRTNSFVRNSRE